MKTMTALIAAALVAGAASADIVQVDINGEVEFNQISGGIFGGVNGGDPVNISFQVDSTVFENSVNFPTRGYNIVHPSFVFTAGSAVVGLEDPFPGGQTPFFTLRDNDPAVDGFFLGTNVDVPFGGVPLDEPGLFGNFAANFSVTYVGDTLGSLDIVDAAGFYDFTGLTVFGMTLLDGPFDAMGMIFSDMTISVVPAPATLALLAPLGLAVRRRRRG